MTKTGNAAGAPLELDAESIGDALVRYQRPLTIAAVLIAVAGGAFYFNKRSGEIRADRGAEALAQAEAIYGSSGPEAAQAELDKVVNRYAGTAAGTQAAHLSAQLYFEAGKYDEGLAVLKPALGKAASHQRPALLALQAAGKASKGEAAASATDYEAAAAAAQLEQERQQYQMEAARQHVAAGNAAAAIKLYQSIAAEEDSPFASEARLRLGEVMVKG